MENLEVMVSKKNEKDMFRVSFKLGDQLIETDLEKSEMRVIIGIFDNATYG